MKIVKRYGKYKALISQSDGGWKFYCSKGEEDVVKFSYSIDTEDDFNFVIKKFENEFRVRLSELRIRQEFSPYRDRADALIKAGFYIENIFEE